MMAGQSYDFVAMNRGECVRKDKQTAIRFACQSIEDIIDVGWRVYVRWDRLHAQKGGRFRDRALIADPARMVWILQDRDARHGRCDLLEQRQPFAAHGVFIKVREPGYIGFRTSRVKTAVLSEASRTWTKTISIVWVSTRSADNPGGVLTTMTSGAELTNSFASVCVRSMSPAAQ